MRRIIQSRSYESILYLKPLQNNNRSEPSYSNSEWKNDFESRSFFARELQNCISSNSKQKASLWADSLKKNAPERLAKRIATFLPSCPWISRHLFATGSLPGGTSSSVGYFRISVICILDHTETIPRPDRRNRTEHTYVAFVL
jgi:hypothetical protein